MAPEGRQSTRAAPHLRLPGRAPRLAQRRTTFSAWTQAKVFPQQASFGPRTSAGNFPSQSSFTEPLPSTQRCFSRTSQPQPDYVFTCGNPPDVSLRSCTLQIPSKAAILWHTAFFSLAQKKHKKAFPASRVTPAMLPAPRPSLPSQEGDAALPPSSLCS